MSLLGQGSILISNGLIRTDPWQWLESISECSKVLATLTKFVDYLRILLDRSGSLIPSIHTHLKQSLINSLITLPSPASDERVRSLFEKLRGIADIVNQGEFVEGEDEVRAMAIDVLGEHWE